MFHVICCIILFAKISPIIYIAIAVYKSINTLESWSSDVWALYGPLWSLFFNFIFRVNYKLTIRDMCYELYTGKNSQTWKKLS